MLNKDICDHSKESDKLQKIVQDDSLELASKLDDVLASFMFTETDVLEGEFSLVMKDGDKEETVALNYDRRAMTVIMAMARVCTKLAIVINENSINLTKAICGLMADDDFIAEEAIKLEKFKGALPLSKGVH